MTEHTETHNVSRSKIHAAAVKAVKAVMALEGKRTQAYKALAEQVIAMRATFTYNGMPDWTGKGQETREAVANIYADAGVPTDSLSGIQSSIRSAIRNIYAERAKVDETFAADLKRLNVNPETNAERSARGSVNQTASATSTDDMMTSTFKVPKEVAAAATQFAAAVTTKDPVACVNTALSILKDASTYDVPADPTALLMALSAVQSTAQAWADSINETVQNRADDASKIPGAVPAEATA